MFKGSTYSIETDKDFHSSIAIIEESVSVALVGASEVGKTSLINALETEQFRDDIPSTNGFYLRSKRLRINSCLVNVYLWDGAGDQMENFIKTGTFKNYDAILYVFAVNDPGSFGAVQKYHQAIETAFPQQKPVEMLVCAKSDLLEVRDRSVLRLRAPQLDRRAQQYAISQNMLYLLVSAKTNNYVADCFVELIKQVILRKRSMGNDELSNAINRNSTSINMGHKYKQSITLPDSIDQNQEQIVQQSKCPACQKCVLI